MTRRSDDEWAAQIDRLAHQARATTSERDRAIRDWHATGATSLRKIGAAAKMSHAAIKRILERDVRES